MKKKYFFLSLTRIAKFKQNEIAIYKEGFHEWNSGQYVACLVSAPPGTMRVELECGRMAEVAQGDILIGALGERFATLEATGSWKNAEEDGKMNLLTSAGLFGKITSVSSFIPNLIELKYMGHLHINEKICAMKDYVVKGKSLPFNTPVILVVGTSMSAGKTTTAKVAIRQLRLAGYKVIAAKLTGAGRYRDSLGMYDAGAEYVTDFVDAGLPSTIINTNEYVEALKIMLTNIQQQNADVVVIEIGASPLEPYNGSIAIKYINSHVIFRIMCASDPYAVYGVMKAFGSKPNLVCGIATNTLGGRKLIENLCGVPSLNIIHPDQKKKLGLLLKKSLKAKLESNHFENN